MKIELKIVKENKDGSADAQVKFDKEGLECLVQWGLVAMIKEGLETYKTRPEEFKEVITKKRKKKKEELDMDGRC